MAIPDSGTLTVHQIAEDLSLKVETVQGLLRSKRIPGGAKVTKTVWRVDAVTYRQWRDATFGLTPKDPYTFTPQSSKSLAAKKAAQTKQKTMKGK